MYKTAMLNPQSTKIKQFNTSDIKSRDYYAFILDNIGPFPKEITQQLPTNVFNAIWKSFYHYLSLVAETANPGGGRAFIEYIECCSFNFSLPNLSEITDCLVLENLSNYK